MVKTGVVLLVLGVAVVAGGILLARKVVPTSTQQAGEMFGRQELSIPEDGQVSLELTAGDTYSLQVMGKVGGAIEGDEDVEVPISVKVLDEAGEQLAISEESVGLYVPKGPDKQIWLASVDDVTAPPSGKVKVNVQVGQLPAGLTLSELKLNAHSQRAMEEGIKGLGFGMLKGGAMICCVGPLLTLVGLIVLIVGLVRGNRQPRE